MEKVRQMDRHRVMVWGLCCTDGNVDERCYSYAQVNLPGVPALLARPQMVTATVG